MQSRIEDDVDNICYLCGRYRQYGESLHLHHIFEGTGRRYVSDEHKLFVHLCSSCHRKIHDTCCPEKQYLHELGQKVYEEQIGTREEFIKDYIRSYL